MNDLHMNEFDIVVVGSGIAGLSFSLYLQELAEKENRTIKIAILSKGKFDQTNTALAQGGIASVAAKADSFEDHIADTMNAGAYMNDKHIVEMVVQSAPLAIKDLQKWGVHFDKTINDEFDLAKEGGHQHQRIWHFEDATGKEIQRALTASVLQEKQCTIFENIAVSNLYKNADGYFCIDTIDNNTSSKQKTFIAKQVVLAGGGIGAAYAHSTNQNLSTGDAIIFAKNLGCAIKNICFVQFHPTGLFSNDSTTYLISEAVRGAGAVLRNKTGEAFMIKYDARKDLAPRDIVSRSIYNEMQLHKTNHVYLDATMIDENIIASHFPNILNHCLKEQGLDIRKQWIPVVPTQHYSCGGIDSDQFAQTNVSGLFAIGECAHTGLHGANRLASNSLLEAIVFAKNAAAKALLFKQKKSAVLSNNKNHLIKKLSRTALQQRMSDAAGVIRSTIIMKETLQWLQEQLSSSSIIPSPTMTDIETNNLYQLAQLILEDALNQTENKGVHFNKDLKYKFNLFSFCNVVIGCI